jgi:hypothetical protein
MLFSCTSQRLCDLCVKSFAVIALRANNVATATATTTTKSKAILFSQRSQSRREKQRLLELRTSFAVPYVIQLHFSAALRPLREKFRSYCSPREQRCDSNGNGNGNSNHKFKGDTFLAEVAEPQRKTKAFGTTYVVCRSIHYSVALLSGSASSA